MLKANKFVLPVVMLLSALALAACATKSKEPVAAEPAAVVAEKAPEVEAAPVAVAVEQPAPVAAATAQPAATPAVQKARKKVHKTKVVAPKAVEPAPAPVATPTPAPVAQPEVPAAAPVVTVQQPAPKAPAPGFLESYWLWLLGIVIAVIAFFWLKKKE